MGFAFLNLAWVHQIHGKQAKNCVLIEHSWGDTILM